MNSHDPVLDRLLPAQTTETMVRGSGGATVGRSMIYAVLATALLAGGWMRFNPQIAAMVPGLAAPGLLAGDQSATSAERPRALVELALLPSAQAEAAVAAMGLSKTDADLLVQSLRQGRVHLVRMPLVDAGTTDETGPSHGVVVSTAGYSTLVQLTHSPIAVPLPVGPTGEVSFSTTDPDGVGIGALGLSGPVRLPDLAPGNVLSVGVIAQ